MEMLTIILNKILFVLFFIACLNTFRHGYYFIQTILKSTPEEPKRYILPRVSLVLLGTSIAYILSVIFTGITI